MSIIHVKDRNEVIEIKYEDIKKYHGNNALMAVAVGFRCLQAAFRELYGETVPVRSEVHIQSGHGGPGFRDAFEYVTRAVTRGVYQVDTSYPVAQYDPHRPTSYAFIISVPEGKAVEISLKENFLPSVFYDYLKKGRENSFSGTEAEEMERLILDLSERAQKLPEEELLCIKYLSKSK